MSVFPKNGTSTAGGRLKTMLEQVLLVGITVLAAFVAILAVALVRLSQKLQCSEGQVAYLELELHLDPLTRLTNRVGLETLLEKEVSRANRSKERLSVLFVDIDHFKEVNDTLGHQGGDVYLKEVASFLRGSSRTEETVTRLGGDEFVIVLLGTDMETAKKAAERYRILVEMAFADHKIPITASIGISCLGQPGVSTVEGLIMAADGAMYFAKSHGGNRWMPYDEATIPKKGYMDE